VTSGHDAGTDPAIASPDLSALLIRLMKGVLYQESDAALWMSLLQLQARVRDYVSVLGLQLVLDEAEGYAFLRSQPEEADRAAPSPRLVARRQLSFPVSLLLALLRKRLAEFDALGGETRLVISRDEVLNLLRVFLPEGSNEARLVDQLDTHLNRVADLGFIKRLPGPDSMIEIRRILKAFVDAQWLSEFDRRLSEYRMELAGTAGSAPE
jgi:hypothetical protein